jgi:hypothetical protein
VIAGLKIADLRGTAGSIGIFCGTGGRDGRDGLVVGFDDYIFVIDLPHYSGQAGGRRLVVRLAHRPLVASIPPARITATRISDIRAEYDLADARQADQQNQGRQQKSASH